MHFDPSLFIPRFIRPLWPEEIYATSAKIRIPSVLDSRTDALHRMQYILQTSKNLHLTPFSEQKNWILTILWFDKLTNRPILNPLIASKPHPSLLQPECGLPILINNQCNSLIIHASIVPRQHNLIQREASFFLVRWVEEIHVRHSKDCLKHIHHS